VVDANNKFVPTGVASTDVAATWRRYEIQISERLKNEQLG